MENSKKLTNNVIKRMKTELKITKPENTIEALKLSSRSNTALRMLGYNYIIDIMNYLKYKDIDIFNSNQNYELAFKTFNIMCDKRNRRIGKKSAFEIAYKLIEFRQKLINQYTKPENRDKL